MSEAGERPSFPADAGGDERAAWVNTLANLRVVADADDSSVEQLLAAAAFQRWKPGQVVVAAAQPADQLFFLVDGVLRVFQEEGESQYTAKLLSPPGHFGEVSQLAGLPLYRSNLSALTEAVTAQVPFAEFERLLASDGAMARAWLYSLARQFSVTIDFLKQNVFGGVAARLCNVLLAYAQIFGSDLEPGWRTVGFDLSYNALAREAACTRRSAINTMQALSAEGAVRRVDEAWQIRPALLEDSLLPGRLSLSYSIEDNREP